MGKILEADKSSASIGKITKSLNNDDIAYFEDYYLVNEVFDKYGGLQDTVSENELKVLENDPAVNTTLDKLLAESKELQLQLKEKISDITLKYELEKAKLLQKAEFSAEQELGSLRAELGLKQSQYEIEVKEASKLYNQKFNKVWNEELEKQGIKNIEPK